MKKLIAMIGAVATAFGLYAEEPATTPNSTATSFESKDAGVTESNTWSAVDAGWTYDDTEEFALGAQDAAELTAAGVYGTGRARRDDEFDGKETNEKFLKLETGAKVLSHGIAAGQVYVDQLVKFTGFEEAQTNIDGKVAVWMTAIEQEGTPAVPGNNEPEFIDDTSKEPDEEGKYPQIANPAYFAGTPASGDYVAADTNLYVSVGDAKGGLVNVKLAGTYEPGKWYRLTIKSLGDVSATEAKSQLGFQIFINGEAVAIIEDDREYNDNSDSFTTNAKNLYDVGQLFTAMGNFGALATVGYQGIGSVDDIIISEVAPDFDQFVEVTIADLVPEKLMGAKVVKIGDVVITDQKSIKVKPGDILVNYAADGAYIVKNGEGVKWTVSADGTLVMDKDATIEVVEAVAKIDTTYYETVDEALEVVEAAQKLDPETPITVEFVRDCSDALYYYTFTPGTTITVTKGGNWDVYVADAPTSAFMVGGLIDLFGAMPEKQIKVTFEDATTGFIQLGGNIYGNGRTDTRVEVVNGTTTIPAAGLVVGDTLAAQDGAGAVLKAALLSFEESEEEPGVYATIALVGKGKVMTKDGTLTEEQITVPEGEELEVSEADADGYYTYQIKGAVTPTGFAIIIAGAQGGATTNYYPTLDAAIAAAGEGGLPSVVTILEDATLTARAEIAKDITIDLGGKTLTTSATCGNAATAFNITAGNVIIKNGTIDGTQVADADTVDGEVDTILVRGGTLTLNDAALTVKVASKNGACVYAFSAGKVNISAGTFMNLSAENYQYKPDWKGMALNQANVADQLITVTGGSFKQVNPTLGDDAALCKSYLAEGYEATLDPETGLYTVAQSKGPTVAKIGDVEYDSLEAAFADAKNGETVVLVDNLTLETAVAIEGSKAIFDLNGKTLDLGAKTLTFTGCETVLTNGTITGTAAEIMYVEGGTIDVYATILATNGEQAYALTVNSTEGTTINVYDGADMQANGYPIKVKKTSLINIYGGHLKGWGGVQIHKDNNQTVLNIYDGIIDGSSTSIAVTDHTAEKVTRLTDSCKAKFKNNEEWAGYKALSYYCADGYEPLLGADGYYMIGVPVAKIGDTNFGSLADALAAAKAGNKVELLTDINNDAAITIDKAITLDFGGKTLTSTATLTTSADVAVTNGTFVYNATSGYAVNIKGGTFTVADEATITYGENKTGANEFVVLNAGKIDVYGTIDANYASCFAIAVRPTDATAAAGIEINCYEGCVVSSYANAIKYNGQDCGGKINIYGGTISSNGAGTYVPFYLNKTGNTTVVKIMGGTFLAGTGTDVGDGIVKTEDKTTTMANFVKLDDTCTAKFNSKKGSGTVIPLAELCVDGYGPVLGDDGLYTIQRVYDVTITAPENGTLETSVTNNIVAGTTVTVTATPASGYELESITTNGTAITGTTFEMPAENVTVAATFKSVGPVIPVDPDEELDENGQANAAKAVEVFGSAEAVNAWAAKVYSNGKIPASKLNATTANLIAIAKEYDLPIMSEEVEVETAQAADGAFTFKLVDGDEDVVLLAAKVEKMIKYSADLSSFAVNATEVGAVVQEDKVTIKATFLKPNNETKGFMKLELTAPTM